MRSPPTRGGWGGGLFGEKGRPRLSFWDTLGAAARDGGGFWVRKRCHGCHGSQRARQRVRVRLFQPSLFSVVSGREGLKGVDVTPPVSICLPETRSESHWRGGAFKHQQRECRWITALLGVRVHAGVKRVCQNSSSCLLGMIQWVRAPPQNRGTAPRHGMHFLLD